MGLALTLVWQRPSALAWLLLPIALLVLARLFDRPRIVPTGTIGIWRRLLARESAQGASARRRVPPALALLCLALALAALALAGPRLARAAGERWTVVVDRTPSMYLAHGDRTRLAAALVALRACAARAGGPRLAWTAAGQGIVDADEPPAEWLRPPRAPAPPLTSFAPDADGCVWLTDRIPAPAPVRAGWIASGGPAVPGPIAVRGAALVVWDGSEAHAVPDAAPRASVAAVGGVGSTGGSAGNARDLPRALADVIDAWAAARGFALGGASPVVLMVHAAAGAEPEAAVECGREGWSASGRASGAAPARDELGELETWCADARSGRALVTAGAGRIHTSLTALDEPRGDPASFAVSWSKLLDRCTLPPPGVVELAERLAAGEPGEAPPQGSSGPADRSDQDLSAWLAWCAVAAALACALGWRRSRSRGWPAGPLRDSP